MGLYMALPTCCACLGNESIDFQLPVELLQFWHEHIIAKWPILMALTALTFVKIGTLKYIDS